MTMIPGKHRNDCSVFPKIHWTVTTAFDCLCKRTELEGLSSAGPYGYSLMLRDPPGRGWERGGESDFERLCTGVGGIFVTQDGTVELFF
jgi:hypothetical protein